VIYPHIEGDELWDPIQAGGLGPVSQRRCHPLFLDVYRCRGHAGGEHRGERVFTSKHFANAFPKSDPFRTGRC